MTTYARRRASSAKPARIDDTDQCPNRVAALWFADQADVDMMMASWLGAWNDPDDSYGSCPESDRKLIRFLAGYMKANDMALWVPKLLLRNTFANTVDGVTYHAPRYRVDAWRQHKLIKNGSWDDDALKVFLALFGAGAHFVVLHDHGDTGIETQDFYACFGKTFGAWTPWGGLQNTSTGHSHYVEHGSNKKPKAPSVGTAYAYPYIANETAPKKDCPFICSLIVDTTAAKNKNVIDGNVEYYDYNTFFQLEGWPGTMTLEGKMGLKGRHGKDFALHQATLWNISTFGLCPYSEKRGTPVFLAPARHRLSVDGFLGMRMPLFAGARETQSWWRPEASVKAKPEILVDT
ncbi:MAG: hypothetical protein QM820_64560 [Minicystis sp.]